MAMLGKEVRMSRLVNPESKKMMAITVDHAISRGIAPMKGLQPIQETIEKIVMGRPDAMTMTKGIAEHCMWPFAGKVALLMKVSNYSPVSPTRDTIFGSVDEAVRMGADAVSMGAMTLGDFQGEQFVYGKGNAAYRSCVSQGRIGSGGQADLLGEYSILCEKRLRAGHGYCENNVYR